MVLYEHNYFRCGPMTRYWCMRFEAKHNYFKDLAQKTKQFKNIAKSLAHRHQRLTCYNLSKSGSLVKSKETPQGIQEPSYWLIYKLYFGNIGQPCKVSALDYSDLFCQACPSLTGESDNTGIYMHSVAHVCQ